MRLPLPSFLVWRQHMGALCCHYRERIQLHLVLPLLHHLRSERERVCVEAQKATLDSFLTSQSPSCPYALLGCAPRAPGFLFWRCLASSSSSGRTDALPPLIFYEVHMFPLRTIFRYFLSSEVGLLSFLQCSRSLWCAQGAENGKEIKKTRKQERNERKKRKGSETEVMKNSLLFTLFLDSI
eukprot:RCo015304